MLYEMALRAFKSDYEKYGVYPPLIKTEKKGFFLPLMFGKVILADDKVIGVCVFAHGSNGILRSENIYLYPKVRYR